MNINRQSFNLSQHRLDFDLEKGTLHCKDLQGETTMWVKKLNDIVSISNISEDRERFFLSCGIDDVSGKFMALYKEDGKTAWYIPGRAFLNILYRDSLFLIFIDSKETYYLLRIELAEGKPIWHHRVDEDLREYTIGGDIVTLTYGSGKRELLRTSTGNPVAC